MPNFNPRVGGSKRPSGLGEHIEVDASGLTAVPGVCAAGNVTDLAAQVGMSAAGGAWAAIRINADLVEEDTLLAMQQRGLLEQQSEDAQH